MFSLKIFSSASGVQANQIPFFQKLCPKKCSHVPNIQNRSWYDLQWTPGVKGLKGLYLKYLFVGDPTENLMRNPNFILYYLSLIRSFNLESMHAFHKLKLGKQIYKQGNQTDTIYRHRRSRGYIPLNKIIEGEIHNIRQNVI